MTKTAGESSAVMTRVKRLAGPRLTTTVRCLIRGLGLPDWGNLRRTTPFSSVYGFDRGQPIDRYYLHRFFAAHRDLITGDVLEIQGNSYTERFGHDLTRADSFDIEPRFEPTYLCDFAHCSDQIPSHAYDCLLLPNTLTHFRELDRCLAQVRRVVRPGGVVLASAAGLLPLTGDVPDYWRLTPHGWREKLAEAWPGASLEIAGHGNCLSSMGAQLGLALEELTTAELDVQDPRFPVLTTMLCRMPR